LGKVAYEPYYLKINYFLFEGARFMIETLDISFIKLVILFLPGIIGMTLFLLLFVPKIKLDFKEKLLYSIINDY